MASWFLKGVGWVWVIQLGDHTSYASAGDDLSKKMSGIHDGKTNPSASMQMRVTSMSHQPGSSEWQTCDFAENPPLLWQVFLI
jgi:hypothetical protein